jgi:hypothetical protein
LTERRSITPGIGAEGAKGTERPIRTVAGGDASTERHTRTPGDPAEGESRTQRHTRTPGDPAEGDVSTQRHNRTRDPLMD